MRHAATRPDMPSGVTYRDAIARCLRADPRAGYVALATLERRDDRADAAPRARMVVFEGFARDRAGGSGALVFKSSGTSNKVRCAVSDAVEAVWWFERSMAQFRIRGTMRWRSGRAEEAADDELEMVRDQTWMRLHEGDKAQFFWSAEDCAASGSAVAFARARERLAERSASTPPEDFCVGLLTVQEVDALYLGDCSRETWTRVSEDKDEWEFRRGYAPPVMSSQNAV